MDLKRELTKVAQNAKNSCAALSGLSSEAKDAVLNEMAVALIDGEGAVIKANGKDVSSAKRAGLSRSLIDRLILDKKRIQDMAASLRALTALPDPVGKEISGWQRPNGL